MSTAWVAILLAAAPGAQALARRPAEAREFRGEILEVRAPRTRLRSDAVVAVILRPDAGRVVEVRLAPTWFLEKRGVRVEPGAMLAGRGADSGVKGAPVILASELQMEGRTVRLRDYFGLPLWRFGDGRSGWTRYRQLRRP